jgi:hypothetical protein
MWGPEACPARGEQGIEALGLQRGLCNCGLEVGLHMVLTTAEKWRKHRRRDEGDDNDDDGDYDEDDDAKRERQQEVSRLAPVTGTVAGSFSLGQA